MTTRFHKTLSLNEKHKHDPSAYEHWIQHPDLPEYEHGVTPRGAPTMHSEVKFPMLAPPVSAKDTSVSGGIILELPGKEGQYPARKYEVLAGLDDWSYPDSSTGFVVFTEMPDDTELTPTEPIGLEPAYCEEDFKSYDDNYNRVLTEKGRQNYEEATSGWLHDEIPTRKATCPPLSLFGRPCFIQGALCPVFEGKPFYNLMTIENGWGDSGNINIMVALDDGYPVAACLEASCC